LTHLKKSHIERVWAPLAARRIAEPEGLVDHLP